MIIEAILSINPKAQVSVNANDINQIIWYDGNPMNITKDQILAQIPIVKQQQETAMTAEAAAKQSALAKLKTLGLTDAEITALIG
jgi:hypothetical protein